MLTGKKRRVALSLAVSAILVVMVRADDTEFTARLNEARQAVLSRAGQGLLRRTVLFPKCWRRGFDKRVKQLKRCRDDCATE